MLADNAAFAAGLAGFALLLVYFLAVWAKVGRDPEGGAIVPEYDPPDGFSPAAARYVAEMGYDAKVFTAAGSTGSVLPTGGAVYITLFSVPFFGSLFFGFWLLAQSISLPAALVLSAIVLINIAFYDLLKAPTRLGRQVMDRIEGFRLYLSVAEKDRMNFHNPPERTPELFERFLPYALALGVEQAWSEQFDRVLAAAGQDPGRANSGYRPGWYSGNRFHGGRISDFASSLSGSFSGAIASSSTAPGSSSGSGGGGSGW